MLHNSICFSSARRRTKSSNSLHCCFRGRFNGGNDLNEVTMLPDKMKTELALHVHLETLRKVSLKIILCAYKFVLCSLINLFLQ